MKHAFSKRAIGNPDECAVCSYSFIAHTPLAKCEACGKKTSCDLYPTINHKQRILMCDGCIAKEAEANTKVIETTLESIKYNGDFYNARITPIVDSKENYEITGDFAALHAQITQQIEHFAKALFEQNPEVKQGNVSKIVINLRAELREKLAETDINYKPPIKPVVKPRVKSEPKAKLTPLETMASYIVATEGKKGNVITVQQAMEILKKELNITT